MLRFVQIRNNRHENRLIFLLLANNKQIIILRTRCTLTFCIINFKSVYNITWQAYNLLFFCQILTIAL